MILNTSNRNNSWTQRVVLLAAFSLPVLCALPALSWDEVGGCTSSEDCNDGVFCNGAETCEQNQCGPGPEACEDGETCNEESDLCIGNAPNPGFSQGSEFVADFGCEPEAADQVAFECDACEALTD